jgi:phosphatidylcholine synthase
MPSKSQAAAPHSLSETIGAFTIHMITASGAIWGFLALLSAVHGNWGMMFYWLGVGLFADGIDGPLARRANLAEAYPQWSGEILDLVVDFVTYVFVPAYAITSSHLLPPELAVLGGMAIVFSSALYFADVGMKLEDNYFSGFPAIWNAAAFYLFLIEPPQWAAAAAVGALVVLTFLPVPFIHPVRVKRHRLVNLTLLVVWSVLAAIALVHNMTAGPVVTGGLCLLGLYILFGGLLRKKEPGVHR